MEIVKGLPIFLLAVVFLFGGLAVWPIARRHVQPGSKRARYLRTVFQCHLVAQVVPFALVALSAWAQSADWLHLLVFPYLVGVLSPVASAIVVLLTRKAKENHVA